MEETPAFRRARETGRLARAPLRDVLTASGGRLAVAFAVSGGAAMGYWLCISYLPTYLNSTVGLSHADALLWSTVATVGFVVTPWAGLLSDVVGRKPVLVVVVGLVVLTAYPLFALLSVGTQVAVAFGVVALAVQVTTWEAVIASAVPEQFATAERLSAMAFGYNLAVAIFGGLTPLVATLLVKLTDNDLAPSFLLVGAALAAFPVLFRLRETAGRALRTR
jgi:MFS transporter, MHS family, proline/betaine transporter